MSIFAYKEQDGNVNLMVCGKVVRDAEIKESGSSHGSRIKFTVNYGKKKFMDCEAWSDTDVGAIASLLEKGDVISVSGTYRSWEYSGRNYSMLSADMISTMAAIPSYDDGQTEESFSSAFSDEVNDSDAELPF